MVRTERALRVAKKRTHPLSSVCPAIYVQRQEIISKATEMITACAQEAMEVARI